MTNLIVDWFTAADDANDDDAEVEESADEEALRTKNAGPLVFNLNKQFSKDNKKFLCRMVQTGTTDINANHCKLAGEALKIHMLMKKIALLVSGEIDQNMMIAPDYLRQALGARIDEEDSSNGSSDRFYSVLKTNEVKTQYGHSFAHFLRVIYTFVSGTEADVTRTGMKALSGVVLNAVTGFRDAVDIYKENIESTEHQEIIVSETIKLISTLVKSDLPALGNHTSCLFAGFVVGNLVDIQSNDFSRCSSAAKCISSLKYRLG
jgi:hypothetical protein